MLGVIILGGPWRLVSKATSTLSGALANCMCSFLLLSPMILQVRFRVLGCWGVKTQCRT